ncbi:Serine/threonine-protein kinase STY17-like protein [Drosera capensis]
MAIDDDTESCSSRAIAAAESSPAAMVMAPRVAKHQMLKVDVYNDVLRRLQDGDFEEASVVGFEDQLWQHFNRLPARYALDVNVERAEDVLMHMRFLRQAQDPANRPVFEVRLVQVNPISNSSPSDSVDSFSSGNDGSHRSIKKSRSLSLHPPPTFGSSQSLEALALQSSVTNSEDGYSTDDTDFDVGRAMHEITFSTADKPKLLN